MGSENARIVAKWAGGWTNGNEFKLLNTMAWNSFDPPAGPDGEPPCRSFMTAQTISAMAFGQFMPDMPPRDKQPFYGPDIADSKAYKSASNRITSARKSLMDKGVVKEIRKAGNWQPGIYELDMETIQKLGEQHFQATSDTHESFRESMKSMEQAELTETPIHEKHGTRSKKTMEQEISVPRKSCSESMKSMDIKNKPKNNSKNKGDESISSKATTLRAETIDGDEIENSTPLTMEQERNRQMQDLRNSYDLQDADTSATW